MRKTKIHQLTSQSHSQMMSYIIETSHGKIIVIDGGTKHDAIYLLGYIKNLSGHVDSWILTHLHSDHIGAIMEIYKNHAGEIEVDRIYHNFPSIEHVEKFAGRVAELEFYDVFADLNDMIYSLSENEILDYGDVKFEILYTADFTIDKNFINNTSTVLKMFADGQTMMFLGDLGIEGGNLLLERHLDEMKSDFVQMAHHGQNGVTFDVYKAIDPDVCFWDTPLWLWNNDAGNGFNTHIWQTVIVRDWIDEIGVEKHFITKDGTNVVELPYEN